MKNILVTGAGGFIGHHLSQYLSGFGHEVIGVDLHFPEKPVESPSSSFKTMRGDFRDRNFILEALKGIDIVFHLASAHLQISLDESEYWDINVHSLQSLLDLCRRNGIQRFIHTSSVGVYGNLKSWPVNEEGECHPQSIYGETKIAGEAEVIKYCEEAKFPYVIIRPAWVYGPGCPRTNKIYRTLKKRRFTFIGKGKNLRHPIYIKDMLEAFRLSMEKDEAVGEVFIIAGEQAITSRELVEGFSKHLNIPGPVFQVPYGFGVLLAKVSEGVFGLIKKDHPLSMRSLEFFNTNNSFDISKARKLLGFIPKFSFERGLQDSKSWLEKNA